MTALRRALREADARLYLQKVATEALTATVAPRPTRPRGRGAAAPSVAAGLLLIVTGECLDGWHRALPAMPLFGTPAANAVARDIALRPDEPRTVNAELRPSRAARRPELVAGRTLLPARRTSNTERSSVKRAVRAQPARARKAPSSRGVLDRLRLNWLRTMFASS